MVVKGLRLLRRYSHLVVLGVVFGATVAVATWTISRRVALGEMQHEALEAMASDPVAFVMYAIEMPEAVSPLGLDDDAMAAQALLSEWRVDPRDDEAFGDLFMTAYGRWSRTAAVDVGEVARRHCGSREFALMVKGNRDEVSCSRDGATVMTTTSSSYVEERWPLDPASCRAGFFADERGRARPSPSGTFSVEGQSCLVLCARGSMCNASKLVGDRCEYPYGAANGRDVDPDVGACPGAQHLTLCPEGYYCPTPIDIHPCPPSFFCPKGTDEPIACPRLLARCPEPGLARPRYYYRSSFVSGLLVFGVACWWSRLEVWSRRKRHRLGVLVGDDAAAVLDFLWRWRRRNRGCRCLLSSRRRVAAWVLPPGGQKKVVVEEEEEEEDHRVSPLVDVSFRGLGLVLADGTVAVENASGECRAGRVTALFGPTGSGKSCLLQLLAGRLPAAALSRRGVVRLNGVDARRVPRSHVLATLVPQSDAALVAWFTVDETLRFYAAIRGQPEHRVSRVIADMGLAPIANARVGRGGLGADRGLSGGERKRVSVAIELVAVRSILYLDEPTSGLDSKTGLLVVAALRAAANRGVCVVSVLHQPGVRVWRCVDDCVVVATEGRVAYVGPAADAPAFFFEKRRRRSTPPPAADDVSPAEFVIDAVSEDDGVEVDFFSSDDDDDDDLLDYDARNAAAASLAASCSLATERSWWSQTGFFGLRCALEVWRHAEDLAYDVVVHGAAGALVGALYPRFDLRESQQVGFVVQLSLGFTISISSARVFGADRETAWRELSTAGGMGLRPTAYFAAKLAVVDLPRLALLVAVYLASWYPAASPPLRSGGFDAYYLPCLAASFAAAGAAHALNIAQDPKTAQLSTVAFLVASAVCSGVAPTLRDLRKRLTAVPAKGLAWASYSRWLVEALFSANIAHLATAWHFPPKLYKNPKSESTLLHLVLFDYDAKSANLDAAILVFLGLAFRLLALAALFLTNRGRMGLRPLVCRDDPKTKQSEDHRHRSLASNSSSLSSSSSEATSLLCRATRRVPTSNPLALNAAKRFFFRLPKKTTPLARDYYYYAAVDRDGGDTPLVAPASSTSGRPQQQQQQQQSASSADIEIPPHHHLI
ncbi:hypothetical protein CTAYLR_008339 [Chrysophaeum taylorii]|uniref:ABC transporter domain-containing protein n=1 Tax=Chrysophaeum taylorii TaxID=2483200 RepID=A0AAD7UCW5_9STRA|nr:hypothetical protein CTAYLR_008339 [Chrysophaeum taylorii]